MFRRISRQSFPDWSRFLPIYLNYVAPSTSSSNSLQNRLTFISTDLWSDSTSLCRNCISVAWSHLPVCLCFSSLAAVIRISQLGHRCSGFGPPCNVGTLAFQCLYMKCSRSLPSFCALARHPSTRHATNVRTYIAILKGNVKNFIGAKKGEARVQDKTCNIVLCSVRKNVPQQENFR